MEVINAIYTRRSIRKFKPDSVPDHKINELIDAGRLAPSGTNLQPARYVVIKSKEIREKLSGCTPLPFVPEAPVIIACCYDTKAYKKGTSSRVDGLDGASFYSYLALNVAIAIDHITLRAVDLGLGSCWVMMFDKEKVRELIGLDAQYELVALLPVGYPDQSPEARPRLDLEQLIIKEI
jgi:nitroreductase